MTDLGALLRYAPAIVAAIVAALVPRQAAPKHRIGLALASLLLIGGALWLAEDPSASDESPGLLGVLIGLPIVGSVAVMFLPRQLPSLLRGATYAVFAGTFAASLLLLRVPMTAGWHFQEIREWIPAAGIRWHVAVDGISLWLIILTTLTTPIAAFASFGSIKSRQKELCAAFLLLEGAMLGAFLALDLFVFYVFWELMLIPMFLMIGVWGGAERIKAAVKFFVFTMTGSVLMLGAMLYMVWSYHELSGIWTFDYLALSRLVLPGRPDMPLSPVCLCFAAFSLAFFIKVPMFPVHTWLPDAHVEAPTGGSVVLAAVMLKLGTYAYLRFSMVMFPDVARQASPTLAGLAIMGGILYAALVAWKQSDFKRLIAYSSVAHLGFVMLGLFGATDTGIEGAILQMVSHGISTGALFLLVGVLYDRRHTRELSEFGGLAKVMPVYAALFIIVTMASVGVPGTNGFIGEFMIIVGTYASEALLNFGAVQAVGAGLGVILAAVYMLSAVQKVFFGPLTNPKNKHLADISVREGLALAPLVVLVFVIGLFPALLLDRMKASVAQFTGQYRSAWATLAPHTDYGRNWHAARLLPEDTLPAPFMKGAPPRSNEPMVEPEPIVKVAEGAAP